MITTNKLPVVIIANYRTGSTALARNLAASLNTLALVEPHYKPDRWKLFTECLSNNNDSFVLKFIAEQLDEFSEYKTMSERDCFKIRLYRENKIDQIVSYYIATITDIWCHTIDSVEETYFVRLDVDTAKYAIDRILYNDRLLDQFPMQFDITTTYEKLGIIENTPIIKTIQPFNLLRVRSFIERIYHESR